MTLVIDANVAAKWYLEEERSAEARSILASDEMLVAPEHILAEVGNVAWFRLVRGEISIEQARAIMEELPGAFVALMRSQDLIVRAVEIAHDIGHPVYDTLYLAASERWDAPLVTDDRALLRKVKASAWAARVRALAQAAAAP